MRNLKKIFAPLFICMIFATAVISAGAVNITEGTASITALYLIDRQPVQDISISVRRIASVNDDMEYAWLDEFEKYKITVDFNDEKKITQAAQTLAEYVSRDSVSATMTDKTNQDGYVSFDNLEPGMYLITGATSWSGRYSYSVIPTLIPLPYTNEDGTVTFDANIELKHESSYHPSSSPSTTIRKALKVWDVEDESKIPEYIKVDLLRDGRLYDTQELSEKNNWTCTWRNLDDSRTWTVVEQSVPDGFTTISSKNGVTYVITNTEVPEEPPKRDDPPSGDEPDEPNKPDDNTPSGSTDTTTTEPDDSSSKDKLPQTGLPWVPVLILSGLGIGCIVIAIICERSKNPKIAKGKYLALVLAIIFVSGAMFLTGRNIGEEQGAGQSSDAVVRHLIEKIPDVKAEAALTTEKIIPNYILNPDMDMPTMEEGGVEYIGVLEIPAISLKLPIQTEWDRTAAKISPCRYVGSVYQNNCIIAGHNYKTHFAKLNALVEGDEVRFTDVEGNVFTYTVSTTEIYDGTDIEGMKAGDWDLTLFTCTIGGKQRVTIRCDAVSAPSDSARI